MKSVIKFIKELLFPKATAHTPIGLSQFKYAKEEVRSMPKPAKQEVRLTELMRKTVH